MARSRLTFILVLACFSLLPSAVTTSSVWPNTRNGTHLFLTFDYEMNPQQFSEMKPDQYVYAWGANSVKPYRENVGTRRMVVTKYVPFDRDPDSSHNLTWWLNFQPSWILYKCDRKTPAFMFGDPNIPLDFSNPDVVEWQRNTSVVAAKAAGYNGMAMDNLELVNGFDACGVWKTPTEWTQIYSGNYQDRVFADNVLTWMKRFYAAVHSLEMLLTINWSLAGLDWNDADAFVMGNHTDAVLSEEGFTSWGSRILDGAAWTNKIWFSLNLQRHGKAYFSINEWGSSNENRNNLTIPQQVWILASAINMNLNASAIFASDIQAYGHLVTYPLFTSFDTGVLLTDEPLVTAEGLYYRNTSRVIAIVNPTSSKIALSLDPSRQYVTVPSGKNVKSGDFLSGTEALVLEFF